VPSITPTPDVQVPAQGLVRKPEPIVYPRVTEQDAVIMGFDPGGSDKKDETGHVGVTLGCRNYVDTGDTYELQWPGWRVYDTFEMDPDEFIRWFARNTSGIDGIYGEMYRLDKEKAYTQIGSSMPTSQLIGWVRMHCMLYAPHIDVVWQPNTVLTGPISGLLRENKIRPVSPSGANAARGSTGDHQRSSELHWWHGLVRGGLVEGVSLA
jgi:hypothetical protein